VISESTWRNTDSAIHPCEATRAVDVWFRFTDDLSDEDFSEARAMLSPSERSRCDRFVFARDKHNFVVAHALLRAALTFLEGGRSPDAWLFHADSHGKPCLAPGQSDLVFNLTHTDRLVACALSGAEPLGIDAEFVERSTDANLIAARCFSYDEAFDLAAHTGPERHTRFIEMWTLKEAFLKATGAGLSTPLKECAFHLYGTSGLQFSPPKTTTIAEWHFALFAPSPGHRLAVAAGGGQRVEFRVRAWPPELNAAPLVPVRRVAGT
jgi:4'-phosphopantetheinyl transferase